MRVALYCHSLRSDWNHGNAHFLRAVVTELQARGNDVCVFEPEGAWGVENLVRDHGQAALRNARIAYPTVLPTVYRPGDHDLDAALDDVALCLIHEWNEPALVQAIGRDLVWIGNWGDDERTAELESFLLRPAEDLGLRTLVHGVRNPTSAVCALLRAGIRFGGWLPNSRAPEVFSRYRFTVHVPRRPYAERLPGIPTIRPFVAMASGIPLISAPWTDSEGLFEDGRDCLLATDEEAMRRHIAAALGATTDKPCHLQGAPA